MAPAKQPKAQSHIRCAYDWADHSRALLECIPHKRSHSITRMPALGHDVLEELHRLKLLTGTAKEEAARLYV